MKQYIFIYFSTILIFGIVGCNFNYDFKKFVPENINNYATGFISEIQKGNIDNCLTLVIPEMSNEKCKQFLTNTYFAIRNLSVNNYSVISYKSTIVLNANKYNNHEIVYEYKENNKFLYFGFGIRELNGIMKITAFSVTNEDHSLSDVYTFSLKNLDFTHFIFLLFTILIPIFIIISLIFAYKSNYKKKWFWMIGILFGFVKFSINWSTGEIGMSLFNFTFLGVSFIKAGNIGPWILSFSIPIIAIIFFVKYFFNNFDDEDKEVSEDKITDVQHF